VAFHRLIQTHQLYDGFRCVVKVGRVELLILHHEGQTHIVDNRCPHQGFPLDRGTIKGERLFCPRHGFGFHLKHGDCFQASSCTLPIYVATYDGQWLGVEL
jgi:nitrite reductase/ring-hydroxylating ferredoxin subunit